MATIAPVDPNIDGLKRRLYSQQVGGDPTAPPTGQPAEKSPSVSPDFAQTGTNQLPTPSKTMLGDTPPAPSSTVTPYQPPLSVYTTGTPATQGATSNQAAPPTDTPPPPPAPTPPPAPAPPPPVQPPATAGPAVNPPATSTPGGRTDTQIGAQMIGLLNEPGGPWASNPQGLADYINQQFGLPSGKSAKYYDASVHGKETIGLPGGYLSHESDGWHWTDRPPGDTGGAPTPKAPPTLAPPAPSQAMRAVGPGHYPGQGVPGVYDFDNAGNPVTAMGAPYTGPMADGSPNPNTAGPAAPAAAGSDFQSQVRAALMARLKELGQPVDEQSSGISSAVSGARDEATRASSQERTALAERLYAQGGGGLQSGALTQQIQQSGEKNAANMSGLRATLIMQQYSQRQQELQQTLNTAVASGDAEAARQAQAAIAALQAQIQREGLGLDAAKYQAYLNQQAALAGLNG